MHELLYLCATPKLDVVRRNQLIACAAQFRDWSALPTLAEEQGLGPLVYSYLTEIAAVIPAPTRTSLQGLYLRHRHANQVRGRLLCQLSTEFQQNEIEFIVLKGAVLAHTVYAKPGLRPMRDIDLLVRKSDILRAQNILLQMGFALDSQGTGHRLPDKHLEFSSLRIDGIVNSLELHYNLFESHQPYSLQFDNLQAGRTIFQCHGVDMYGLRPEDMLLHLCEHIRLHASIWRSLRLIWVVDIVGYAEQYVAEIDWAYVRRQTPSVMNLLSLFHTICPLSAKLLEASQVKIGSVPQGVGDDYQGWPRYSLAQLRGKSYREILNATYAPSEWWLRIRYGLDAVQPLFVYRWLLHPLYILGPFYLLEKVHLLWHLGLRPLFDKSRVRDDESIS